MLGDRVSKMESKGRRARNACDDSQSGRCTRSKTRGSRPQAKLSVDDGLGKVYNDSVLFGGGSAGISSRQMDPSLEENLLALLDRGSTFRYQPSREDILEDKMLFLEAIHSLCVVASLPHVPTPTMCRAILGFIGRPSNVGLSLSTFELLSALEERHPRVAVSCLDSEPNALRLITDQKLWSPFDEDMSKCCVYTRPRPTQDISESRIPVNIVHLVEDIASRSRKMGSRPARKRRKVESDSAGKSSETHSDEEYVFILSQYLMLRHLFNLIKTDLLCRCSVFKASEGEKGFDLISQSYLHRLLISMEKGERHNFIVNLDVVMNFYLDDSADGDLDFKHESQGTDVLADCWPEEVNRSLQATPFDFGRLASQLLDLVMKVDSLQKEHADSSEWSYRTLFDNLLNICSQTSTLDIYLRAISDPNAKLKFVVDYFVNFAPKQVGQSLADCAPEESMEKLLDFFSDKKVMKSIVQIVKEPTALPLLLSHGLQAYLLLHKLGTCRSETRFKVCRSMLSVLTSLKENDKSNQILPVVEETLFIVRRISS